MSEADAVALSTRGPVTRDWLRRDLAALGIQSGAVLMVQASLSKLGWIIGGAPTVVAALRDIVGNSGTLVMPTFCSSNTEPGNWRAPPVPESWWPIIRAEMPGFDPATTPSRIMGAIPEYFRTLPEIHRSAHPAQSWAAQGPLAAQITAAHSLDCGNGDNTPLGRCYELSRHVLCLATKRTTALHLADYRSEWPGKYARRSGSATMSGGVRQWTEYENHWSDGEDFEQIRLDFIASHPPGTGTWQEGPVAYSTSRLFAIRPLIDFAVKWMEEHRR